jgi:two-component system, NtrC family, sensor kinase
LLASLLAVLILGWLSSRSAEEALATALADHVAAQAGLAAAVVGEMPLDTLSIMGDGRASARMEQRLEELALAGELHDLAVFEPGGKQLSGARGVDLMAARAEQDLIARAAQGEQLTGTLYRGREGVLYLTGYVPVKGHPGWVVAVEGSGAVLGAVDRLERLNLLVGAVVVLVAGLFGAGLAQLVVRPIQRLDQDLRSVSPGDPPERIQTTGPREVRGAAMAVRGLLGAIVERDAEIEEAHQREVEQVRRMAAEIAHEVRNPLNALGLSAQSLAVIRDDAHRQRLVTRITNQVEQLEAIVQRLVDVTRPLVAEYAPVNLLQLARESPHPQSPSARAEPARL